MLAHHTVGGCPMRTGDLIATGTLSGPTREELGCLLEITRNGKESLEMNAKDASSDEKVVRTFLLDGDTVEFDAKVEHKDGYSIGFGTCVGTVLSSKL
jgi:fumarylacetoacetase